jgi:hypothetical protein
MNTRNFPDSKTRPAPKVHNLTVILQQTGGPRAGSGQQLDLLRPPRSLRFILKNLNFTIVMTSN